MLSVSLELTPQVTELPGAFGALQFLILLSHPLTVLRVRQVQLLVGGHYLERAFDITCVRV